MQAPAQVIGADALTPKQPVDEDDDLSADDEDSVGAQTTYNGAPRALFDVGRAARSDSDGSFASSSDESIASDGAELSHELWTVPEHPDERERSRAAQDFVSDFDVVSALYDEASCDEATIISDEEDYAEHAPAKVALVSEGPARADLGSVELPLSPLGGPVSSRTLAQLEGEKDERVQAQKLGFATLFGDSSATGHGSARSLGKLDARERTSSRVFLTREHQGAAADVCQDLDALHDAVDGYLKRLSFLLIKLGNIQAPRLFRQRHARRIVKVDTAFAEAVHELQRMLAEVHLIREWVGEEVNVCYATHVALVAHYGALILGSKANGLACPASAARVKLDMYRAKYDGVTVEDLIALLESTAVGVHWKVDGDFRLLASRLHGVNEVIHMIYSGRCCSGDNVVIRMLTGEYDLFGQAYANRLVGLYDEAKADRALKRFLGTLLVANASVSRGLKRSNPANQAFHLCGGGVYYGCLRTDRGRHRGEVCYTGNAETVMEKTLPFAKVMWNLPDRRLVKAFYRIGLPRVRHSVAFRINATVSARFISAGKVGALPRDFSSPKRLARAVRQRAVVLHFHGGGFISMSAASHEIYTRNWAKQLGCPIVSVDYSLAPEHPFPVAVDEAFEAYKWCRAVACKAYGTDKIVLVGDSAGGTLCAAVAIRCIMECVRGPHAMLLVYPALDIKRAFTPSMLWTINDLMIPFLFLQSCLAAYLGTNDVDKLLEACQNPLASPNAASDEIVAQFPRCHIVAAERDPLFDKAVEFSHRMARLTRPGQVKLTVVPGMIHGFLSLNWPLVGVPQVAKLIEECGKYLNAMIDAPEEVPVNSALTQLAQA